ncbi:hypothetical protein QSH39_015980 [Xanthomonas arboricola pv. corylina]|uniref:hypothetical protein n=1 Tax=Xanthomonas TaxID=338 RepID=UPI000CED9358|nr:MULTISPECIES: hypothetical protein [Xanthomonas]MDN0204072.1 hypothetical protein [Xanthomonas arboricola pv. corylina]MDN0217058.1 hypothetical protein [Xanthomonas arboricola pv. corylina]PPU59370.1 hypothetical protein XacyCFBP1159_15560 [Xanthomonas arboricola pv. corylina]CAE6737875.1 hypothetical protein CFBP6600_13490 [Xanthomonas arboricola pv. corylina]CAE6737899.1 hypothetical protein CFBP6600_13490 [Xanthomonas arboricola pv. corylina]
MNLDRVIAVSRAAQRNDGPGPLSTGEALTAALVLNRHDWLADMDYTIAQALDRIDEDTIAHLRQAERAIRNGAGAAEENTA